MIIMKKLLLSLILGVSIPAYLVGNVERYLDKKVEQIMFAYDTYQATQKIKQPVEEVIQDVVFTSYYVGDSSGSNDTTGSGLTSEDFEVNEKGWYTYEGKVVVATATIECLSSNTGACSMYNKLPEGYHIKSYFDEMLIKVDGVEYPAIVLDSCGASFWDEEKQRVDIYVSDEAYSVGKVDGSIFYYRQ